MGKHSQGTQEEEPGEKPLGRSWPGGTQETSELAKEMV